ncbi:archaea-specific SMC-related protein [Halobacteriaceae archaeon SHR40]|uniref:archaea-specific SMC-related protein n=1 Tax=Halovenus amylolytica TaxID=2500550 RepID=UPI000FE2A22C
MSNTGTSDLSTSSDADLHVEVSNLGGIEDCSVEIPRGVTVLVGENATNRTSLLRSIASALGADETGATLKTDSTDGYVRLSVGEETYNRTYERTGSHVSVGGSPFTTEPKLVDTFAVMLADNHARRAVELNGDLREVLMRPVDTDEIQRQITELKDERKTIAEKRERIESERTRLPELRNKREKLQTDLVEIESEIEELEASVSEYEIEESGAKQAEQLLEDLQDGQQELADIEDKIRHHREKLTTLQKRYAEAEEEIESLDVPVEELERLSDRIDTLKTQKRELEATINDLEAILEVNSELLKNETSVLDEPDELTGKLDPASQSVQCWTCGSSVQRDEIQERIDTLRTVVAEKRTERNEVTAEIEEVRTERNRLNEKKIELKEIENRRRELEREIKYRNEQISKLTEDAATKRDEIERLQREAEQSKEIRDSDLVDIYERLSDRQYERGRIEEEIENVENEIVKIERRVDEEAELNAREDEITEELTALRGRIESLERSAVEAFNERMAEVLDILEYENISRIWIERLVSESSDEADIELHVVREDNGSAYEDTVETLSESERKLIGFVVALAGYLVHDVHETLPIMLLDSLEAIDANRIAALLEYFAEFTPYLIAALLPEDAADVSEEYTIIRAKEF